jgi:glycosyltransferase involved in cell wall biosynthesis
VIDRAVRDAAPDLIHLSSPLLRRLDLPRGIPVIADCHNVEHDSLSRVARTSPSRVRRLYSAALARRLVDDEATCAGGCDALLCVSERDRQLFAAMVPGTPTRLMPNGVDPGFFSPGGADRLPASMVFTGTMNYPPNDTGIRWFVEQILPLIAAGVPGTRLTIVGAGPSRAVQRSATERVRITGYVEDVRPFLERAEVCVVPILAGGGTRLKILEAMAMGTPVVSTSVGCEGLDLRDGEHLLVADGPGEFARAVLRLFREPGLCSDLALRARETVRERFGWERVGSELRAVYEEFTGARPRRRREGAMFA